MRQSYIGMAEGGAQPNISKEKIVNSLLPLPPVEEQLRIVAKIEELLTYVDRYAEAYEKLEQFNAKFPEDMKKSILQYAIQGKLVEQSPEEGTGEELYRQIQTEKQRLIKGGKIKKESHCLKLQRTRFLLIFRRIGSGLDYLRLQYWKMETVVANILLRKIMLNLEYHFSEQKI